MSTQPVHDRLLKSDKEVERPDLATVGVTRDLEIDPRVHGVHDLLGLMREEQGGQSAVGSR